MDWLITPGNRIFGEAFSGTGGQIPGDKSISHRVILLAAIADGTSVIENVLVAGVSRVMLDCLTQLGVDWRLDGTTLTVHGKGLHGLQAPANPLFCGNSATTIRLLTGLLALAGLPAILDGSPGLRRRPMDRIIEPLQAIGVPISASPGGVAPLTLQLRPSGQKLSGGEITLPVASAQVKSCLMLAGLAASTPFSIIEPGPSRDHTERLFQHFGIQVTTTSLEGSSRSIQIAPPPTIAIPGFHLTVPGDISATAFLLAAASIVPGSSLTLRNIGINPTRTGILDTLAEMGADMTVVAHPDGLEPTADITIRHKPLKGVTIGGERIVRLIDEVPALCAIAAYAQGQTIIRDAQELRHKESDRIHAMITQLNRLGIPAQETPDGLIITGTQPAGGNVAPSSDHRLAMSLAIAGLAASGPVTIQHAEIADESFPGFAGLLNSFGAHIQVIDDAS